METYLLIQLISNSTVKIGKKSFDSDNGLVQGSPLSPDLFNVIIDDILTLTNEADNETDMVSFADDLAVAGDIDFDKFEKIYNGYGLKVNYTKTISIGKKIKNEDLCLPRHKGQPERHSHCHRSGLQGSATRLS